jgi:hypothetical protein
MFCTSRPASPTASPTTVAPESDQTTWRFGDAGLGPVELGMTLAEASAAAGEELVLDETDICRPPQKVRVVGAPLDNLMHEGRVGTIVALLSQDAPRVGLYCAA